MMRKVHQSKRNQDVASKTAARAQVRHAPLLHDTYNTDDIPCTLYPSRYGAQTWSDYLEHSLSNREMFEKQLKIVRMDRSNTFQSDITLMLLVANLANTK